MEKWVYLFETEKHQVLVRKNYDEDAENYEIQCISMVEGVEAKISLKMSSEEQRDEIFQDKNKMKDYIETTFENLLNEVFENSN